MDPVDPFTADNSPRARAFKQAWRHAIEEGGRLEPLPEGVTGEEQRRRVVAAYERAVEIMPEAPPCASFLERIGRTWNGWFGEAREKPDKAIEAYRRVIKEYPDAHRFVISAWGGIGHSESLKKNYTAAAAAVKKVLEYQLPDDPTPELMAFAEQEKKYARRGLRAYSIAAARLYTVDGEVVVSGESIGDIVERSIEDLEKLPALPKDQDSTDKAIEATTAARPPARSGANEPALPTIAAPSGWAAWGYYALMAVAVAAIVTTGAHIIFRRHRFAQVRKTAPGKGGAP